METKKFTTKDITEVGIAAALVFAATFLFKIPSPNGYVHLGDSMIFISIVFLGMKKGALSGSIGAALADALGGYVQWIIPTFMIKGIMSLIVGFIAYKLFPQKKFAWIIGSVFGGMLQIGLYAAVKIPLYDMTYALVSLPGDTIQTVFGIVSAVVVVGAMEKTGIKQILNSKK